jgi:hypothetical protein
MSSSYKINRLGKKKQNNKLIVPAIFSWFIWITLIGSLIFLWQNGVIQGVANKLGLKSFKTLNNNKKSTSIEEQFSTSKTDSIAIATKPTLQNIEYRSLNMGNIFFGRYIDDWSMRSGNPGTTKLTASKDDLRNYSYPFSGLNSFDRSKYDSWIAGLECPVTENFRSSEDQDTDLKFNCLPGYLTEAAKWFNAFTLSNNHTDNMEEINGFEKTKTNLEKNNLQYFGHFDNAKKDDICEIISMPARGFYSDKSIKKINIPIAYCGFHNVFKLPLSDEIAMITKYSKLLPTFVFPHQGAEYTTTSDAIKRETYRAFIDAGADIVIGDHPHTVQETEVYNSKLIVYSLGNFIFDQQANFNVRTGIALDIDMAITGSTELENLIASTENKCSKFKDDCYNIIKNSKVPKMDYKFKFDIIASDNNDKLTKKASLDTQNLILQRTSWARTLEQYKSKN